MPVEIKQQHGTYRADRDGHPLAIPHDLPEAPSWLDDHGRKFWDDIIRLFADAKLLTKLDQVALGLLCDAIVHYVKFRNDAEAAGWTSISEKGAEYQHPSVGMMNKAFERITKLLIHFGMTPVARAKLAMGNREADDDPMSGLLKKMVAKRAEN